MCVLFFASFFHDYTFGTTIDAQPLITCANYGAYVFSFKAIAFKYRMYSEINQYIMNYAIN